MPRAVPSIHDIGADQPLRRELAQMLPVGAQMQYDALVGGLFGDTLQEVVTFALISFLHDRATTIGHFRRG